MTVYMYVLFLCMGALKDAPVTPPFILGHDWPFIGKSEGKCLPWIIIPLSQSLTGNTRVLNFSEYWTAWGIPQTKTVSSKNCEAYNLGVHSILVTRFHCTQQLQNMDRLGFLNSLGELCWLDFPRWSYCCPLGLNIFEEKLHCVLADYPNVW